MSKASWLVAGLLASMGAAAADYRNPILFADYSDPDVIRVGDRYFMTASSFHFSPGLPLLESRDLVHWTLIGHALGLSDKAFGLWAGLAVDNTAEASAAGAIFSDAAGKVAVLVKTTRNAPRSRRSTLRS